MPEFQKKITPAPSKKPDLPDSQNIGSPNFVAPYSLFALHYDRLMRHVPYQKWATYILREATLRLGHLPDTILDVGCGTGSLLASLADSGLSARTRFFGLDFSPEMLKKARSRLQSYTNVHLLEGDLSGRLPFFEDKSIELLVSSHDSLNYLIEEADLSAHLSEARRIAREDGIYICDFVSLRNIQLHFHDKLLTERLPGGRLVWSNHYNSKERLLDSRLRFFTNQGECREERHMQRYRSPDELAGLFAKTGWTLLAAHGDYESRPYRVGDSFHVFTLGAKSPSPKERTISKRPATHVRASEYA